MSFSNLGPRAFGSRQKILTCYPSLEVRSAHGSEETRTARSLPFTQFSQASLHSSNLCLGCRNLSLENFGLIGCGWLSAPWSAPTEREPPSSATKAATSTSTPGQTSAANAPLPTAPRRPRCPNCGPAQAAAPSCSRPRAHRSCSIKSRHCYTPFRKSS